MTSWYPLLTYPLTDRMQLQVNLANGNLLAEATDVAIKGTGHDLVVGRVWQSISPVNTGGAFASWRMTAGPDVQLNGLGPSQETFIDGTGARYTFTKVGGAWTAPAGIDATLAQNQDQSTPWLKQVCI